MTDYPEYGWKQQLDALFNSDMVKWPISEIHQFLRGACKDDAFNYAQNLYSDSLKGKNKENLFKSVVIIDLVKGSLADLDFSQVCCSLIEKIKEYFLAIQLNVGVPDDACYSDKKQLQWLEEAVANKDAFEIISKIEPFLDSYNFAIISDSIVGLYARVLWIIDKDFVIDYLKENEWSFKMELVLYSLRTEFDEIVSLVIDGKNRYPYLYMMKFLIADLDNGLKRRDITLDRLPDYSGIFGTFIDGYAHALGRILVPFRLAISASFNYFAGWVCSEHQELLKKYLPFLIETQENAQEAFAYGYVMHGDINKVFEDSWMILNSLVSNCVKSYSSPNLYSGFINLFIVGLAYNCSTKVEYQNRLSNLLSDIDELQYSWGERNYSAKIFIALYFILANKKKSYSFEEFEIKTQFPILLDKRYERIFGEKILATMLDLLKDPNSVQQIALVESSGKEKIVRFV